MKVEAYEEFTGKKYERKSEREREYEYISFFFLSYKMNIRILVVIITHLTGEFCFFAERSIVPFLLFIRLYLPEKV
jgi:hypothetical protein